jgi:pimeloyl-ACP methyl ester carboxylesterase
MFKSNVFAWVMVVGIFLATSSFSLAQDQPPSPQTGYASVDGLEMYYEIYGARSAGEPLVIIHGALMSIVSMGEIVPRLAQTRQVIAVELQGHGRTADTDRPLSFELMADDVAALIESLNLEQADIFGYSMGSGVALQVAIRHPEVVHKLVVASVAYNSDGFYPEVLAGSQFVTPEMFTGSPWEQDYVRLAPNPEGFPALVEKTVQLNRAMRDWPPESIQAVAAPTLIIVGDSDIIRPEHAVDLFRLRGGGVPGDLTGLPNARLAVLPGTTHATVITRVNWLDAMMGEFLDAPAADGG